MQGPSLPFAGRWWRSLGRSNPLTPRAGSRGGLNEKTMDIKEQAHKYLIDKGCLSLEQTYTAFQVQKMLTEFAQEQIKLFIQPSATGSVCEHNPIEKGQWYECSKCGEIL